jgi:hypothetical protein
MASTRKRVGRHSILTGQPRQFGGLRKQIGCMGRTRILLAVLAMAQVKVLEIAFNLECHGAAKAGTRMNSHRCFSIAVTE